MSGGSRERNGGYSGWYVRLARDHGAAEMAMTGTLLSQSWSLLCCLVVAATCLSGSMTQTLAAPLRSAAPQSLRSCVAPTPELPPLFVKTPAETDDDDDDDDDEFDEDAVRGWLTADGTTCMALGGSVTAGLNGDAHAVPKGRVTSLRGRHVTTFPLTALGKLDAISTIDGTSIAAGLTIAHRSGSDMTLDRAMVSIGALKAGRDVSTFVFFDGADFSFSARTPARQAVMFAYTMQLTDSLSVTAAVENPPDAAAALATGVAAAPGARWPDMIGRVLYEGDALTFHASGALRELRRADGGSTRLASAFLIGGSRDVEIGGVTHTLLAQGGGTWGAPVFIGSQLDSTEALGFLTGGDISNGWSAIASLTSAWSKTVSTSAYASRYALRVPNRSTTTGRIDISRYAMNVVWAPAPMVKVGLEAGWSHSDITLPRLALNGTSTQRASVTVWLQKNF